MSWSEPTTVCGRRLCKEPALAGDRVFAGHKARTNRRFLRWLARQPPDDPGRYALYLGGDDEDETTDDDQDDE